MRLTAIVLSIVTVGCGSKMIILDHHSRLESQIKAQSVAGWDPEQFVQCPWEWNLAKKNPFCETGWACMKPGLLTRCVNWDYTVDKKIHW